jgi:hypothetical protein
MSRALARKKDTPLALIIGPVDSQIDELQYREDEVARLNEELEELRGLLEPLKHFRDLLSLDCPKNMGRKSTILECAGYRKRGDCITKLCLVRQGLIGRIIL